MPITNTGPREFRGGYDLRGSYRAAISTGAVTTVAAGTSTAGHILSFRWDSSTSTKCFLRRVAARFILTTAYGSAQETGCDLILATGYSASHTNATAVDLGSSVTNTGKLMSGFGTSLMDTSGQCRVADTGALTAGTHTLHANPIGVLSDWSGAIGDMVPRSTSGAASGFGELFDARDGNRYPIMFTQNEGFIVRNKILMGATGVGRWDFLIEWDEGVPH